MSFSATTVMPESRRTSEAAHPELGPGAEAAYGLERVMKKMSRNRILFLVFRPPLLPGIIGQNPPKEVASPRFSVFLGSLGTYLAFTVVR